MSVLPGIGALSPLPHVKQEPKRDSSQRVTAASKEALLPLLHTTYRHVPYATLEASVCVVVPVNRDGRMAIVASPGNEVTVALRFRDLKRGLRPVVLKPCTDAATLGRAPLVLQGTYPEVAGQERTPLPLLARAEQGDAPREGFAIAQRTVLSSTALVDMIRKIYEYHGLYGTSFWEGEIRQIFQQTERSCPGLSRIDIYRRVWEEGSLKISLCSPNEQVFYCLGFVNHLLALLVLRSSPLNTMEKDESRFPAERLLRDIRQFVDGLLKQNSCSPLLLSFWYGRLLRCITEIVPLNNRDSYTEFLQDVPKIEEEMKAAASRTKTGVHPEGVINAVRRLELSRVREIRSMLEFYRTSVNLELQSCSEEARPVLRKYRKNTTHHLYETVKTELERRVHKGVTGSSIPAIEAELRFLRDFLKSLQAQ